MTMDLSNIEFSADLRCEIDSSPLTIRSTGRTIVVEVPDVATGLKLFRLGLPRGSRRKRLHLMKKRLGQLASAVDVRINGKSVFRLGHSVGSQWWRILGLPALQLRPLRLRSAR